MEPVTLAMRHVLPVANAPNRTGPILRALLVGNVFELSVLIPGHSEARSGTCSPEQLVQFGKQLMQAGNQAALDLWNQHKVDLKEVNSHG